jgi:hypothetical protein
MQTCAEKRASLSCIRHSTLIHIYLGKQGAGHLQKYIHAFDLISATAALRFVAAGASCGL